MAEVNDNWQPDDKLNRKEAADFLTGYLTKRFELVSKHDRADTFVLNIRADWGFGKTFFLHRWSEDLRQTNFPVVFFNAWENDYCDDPLIGFIAEINDSLATHFNDIPIAKRHLDEALAIGRKLIKPVSLGIASVIAKQLSGLSIEKLHELYSQNGEELGAEASDMESSQEGVSSLISRCAELALKEHLDTKETIKVFKNKLARLIATLENESKIQLPLFVFIDELDRCRPTYAIELLEAVKHLFGVHGVYFVIATNLDQLGHSICAVYGEQFDAERYLKRFFDQEYLLPLPDNEKFTELLFSRYSLDEFGQLEAIIEDGMYPEPPEQALFTVLCNSFNLGLRDREQVASALQAVLLNWPEREAVHLAYLLFLIITKQISIAIFRMLAENQLMEYASFKQAIKLRGNSKFKTRTNTHRSDHYSSVKGECDVIELLWAYHSFHNQSCIELLQRDFNAITFPDKVGFVIARDCPRSFPSHQEPAPPIFDYARRVSQSGQLFVGVKEQDSR